MPKIPIDYSNGLIYSIVCKTDETMLYIGSTTNFTKRKSEHKKNTIDDKSKKYHIQKYVMIRANGGWDNFEMKPIKEFPCESKIQLVIEEERIRVETKANLNAMRAYRTTEEHKEYNKTYNEKHKEHRTQLHKKCYETHSDKKKERSRKQYAENKEEMKENNKEYREAHKEEIKKSRQMWYQANIETIRANREANREKINENARKSYEAKKQKQLKTIP